MCPACCQRGARHAPPGRTADDFCHRGAVNIEDPTTEGAGVGALDGKTAFMPEEPADKAARTPRPWRVNPSKPSASQRANTA
jgi:hypothetical protein